MRWRPDQSRLTGAAGPLYETTREHGRNKAGAAISKINEVE